MIRAPRTVSLKELMQRVDFRALILLTQVESMLAVAPTDKVAKVLSANRRDALRDCLELLDDSFSNLGLVASAATASRMRAALDNPATTHANLGPICSELVSRVVDETTAAIFLSLDPTAQHFYTDPNLFGNEVAEKFVASITDVEEAGKCLALGRGTACVFHLMRVVEVGLKSLAKQLGIPYAPSWESYIKQINDRIGAKHKKKGIVWKRDETYFKEIAGDLLTVKVAWRNPTMHVVRTYTPEEAEQVFLAVRTLMQRIAKRATA